MGGFFCQGCTWEELPFPDKPSALINQISLFLAHSFEGKFAWQKTSMKWTSPWVCAQKVGAESRGQVQFRVRVAQTVLRTLRFLVTCKLN